MMIVDAHLDLAYNVTRGRDPRMPAARQPIANGEIATVGMPDLRAGNVGLVCATIFTAPRQYKDSEGARAIALQQLKTYRSWFAEGELRLVKSRSELPTAGGTKPIPVILLMESADPIRTPDDLPEWFDAGLRIIGMAWERTRYAGGTGAPGPLAPEGKALVKAMDKLGIIHDASHLAEQSFWDLMDLTDRPVMASHSNCRAIVGEGDRHLTDDMIRAIANRGGVIGINFYDRFLLPTAEYGHRRAKLSDVIDHMKRMCDLSGSARHVAIGTDMDGGLGRNEIPEELTTAADLPKVADALSAAGFSDSDVVQIMGKNWLDFFGRQLPAAVASQSC